MSDTTAPSAENAPTGNASRGAGPRRGWLIPAILFVVSFAVFAAFAAERVKGPSPDNHFVYQADAWLNGQLELTRPPPHGNDWASWEELTLGSGEVLKGIWLNRSQGSFRDLRGRTYVLKPADLRGSKREVRYFVSFPSMPSVLMLPGVALWGYGFNDVLFTIFFAALNVPLCWLLLRRLSREGRSVRGPPEDMWLTVLFGFGTAHLWCSVQGAVWFTALVIGVTFTLLYVWFSLDAKHPFLAGLALACGFATRTPLLFSVVFFAAFFFCPGGRLRRDWGTRFWRDGLLFVSAPLVVGLLLMWQNWARFESLGEFGHTYLAGGQLDRIKTWGLFHWHFLTRNLTAAFVLLPKFQAEAPWIVVSRHGLALWFTTPALVWLLWPRPRTTPESALLHRALWATVAVIAVPHLFYQNTGWVQFGYRFSLDYLVYLVVLLAVGGPRVGPLFRALIVFGVIVNAFGAYSFGRHPQHYADWFFEE